MEIARFRPSLISFARAHHQCTLYTFTVKRLRTALASDVVTFANDCVAEGRSLLSSIALLLCISTTTAAATATSNTFGFPLISLVLVRSDLTNVNCWICEAGFQNLIPLFCHPTNHQMVNYCHNRCTLYIYGR